MVASPAHLITVPWNISVPGYPYYGYPYYVPGYPYYVYIKSGAVEGSFCTQSPKILRPLDFQFISTEKPVNLNLIHFLFSVYITEATAVYLNNSSYIYGIKIHNVYDNPQAVSYSSKFVFLIQF